MCPLPLGRAIQLVITPRFICTLLSSRLDGSVESVFGHPLTISPPFAVTTSDADDQMLRSPVRRQVMSIKIPSAQHFSYVVYSVIPH